MPPPPKNQRLGVTSAKKRGREWRKSTPHDGAAGETQRAAWPSTHLVEPADRRLEGQAILLPPAARPRGSSTPGGGGGGAGGAAGWRGGSARWVGAPGLLVDDRADHRPPPEVPVLPHVGGGRPRRRVLEGVVVPAQLGHAAACRRGVGAHHPRAATVWRAPHAASAMGFEITGPRFGSLNGNTNLLWEGRPKNSKRVAVCTSHRRRRRRPRRGSAQCRLGTRRRPSSARRAGSPRPGPARSARRAAAPAGARRVRR
jgi:hypothetical protein